MAENKKVIVYGNDLAAKRIITLIEKYGIFVDYYVDDSETKECRSIYDLLYENVFYEYNGTSFSFLEMILL